MQGLVDSAYRNSVGIVIGCSKLDPRLLLDLLALMPTGTMLNHPSPNANDIISVTGSSPQLSADGQSGLCDQPRSFLPIMAPITHVVIFQYKSNASIAQKENISKAFLALQQNCLAPFDAPGFDSPGTPYIQSIIAGSNDSLEPPAEEYEVSGYYIPTQVQLNRATIGQQHTYIVTFASPIHRDYYVGLPDPKFADPAHAAFKEIVGPLLEKVVVTDFSNGVWANKGPGEKCDT